VQDDASRLAALGSGAVLQQQIVGDTAHTAMLFAVRGCCTRSTDVDEILGRIDHVASLQGISSDCMG